MLAAVLLLPQLLAAPARVCRSEKHCAFVAREALLEGDLSLAEKAAGVQLYFQECGDSVAPTAAETLARIALRRGRPLLAQAWLGLGGASPDLRREVATAVAALPRASGPGGEYALHLTATVWNTVTVQPRPDGRLHFSLDASRVSTRRCQDMQGFAGGDLSFVLGPQGGMEGDAVRKGDVFVYETREFGDEDGGPCVMTFRFAADALTVIQDGTDVRCGFGAGVDASGEYVRTSR